MTRLVRDENLDLYLLGLVAPAFTVLGVVGLAETSVLISATLALLAMMVDPDDEPVIAAAALIGYSGSDPALLAGRIRGVLAELDHLRSLTGGNLEIRLTRHVPRWACRSSTAGTSARSASNTVPRPRAGRSWRWSHATASGSTASRPRPNGCGTTGSPGPDSQGKVLLTQGTRLVTVDADGVWVLRRNWY